MGAPRVAAVLGACAVGCLGVPGFSPRDGGGAPAGRSPAGEGEGEGEGDDGGPGVPGSVEGEVAVADALSCDDEPETDCEGRLYLFLTAEDPLGNPFQRPEAFTAVATAPDGAPTAFRLPAAPPGRWWLGGFLDDDVSLALPAPDQGDPIAAPAVQVDVEPARVARRDLTLAARLP